MQGVQKGAHSKLISVQRFSVQPKPGFGIRNQNQDAILVFVSEPGFFFRNQNFFSIFFFQASIFFSFFPTYWGDTSLNKLENKSRSSKII